MGIQGLPEQTVSINFGQGLDTKTDPKLVMNGRMLNLQNAVFTKGKRLQKRNGYKIIPQENTSSVTLTNQTTMKVFKEDLTTDSNGRFYARSVTENRWFDRGKYVPTTVSTNSISSNNASEVNASFVQLGNIAMYVYEVQGIAGAQSGGGTGNFIYLSVVDISTNTFLIADEFIYFQNGGVPTFLNPIMPQAFLLGGNQLAFTYTKAHLHLVMRTVSVSPTGVTVSAEIPIVDDLARMISSFVFANDVATSINDTISYYILGTATGAVICYAQNPGSPTNLVVITINTSGSITHTFTMAFTNPFLSSIVLNLVTGDYWVYFMDNNGGFGGWDAYYLVLSPTLTTVLGQTFIASNITLSADAFPLNITAYQTTTSTQQNVFFSLTLNGAGGAISFQHLTTGTATVDVSGTVTNLNGFRFSNLAIYSTPFQVTLNGIPNTYIALNNCSSVTQATLFIIDVADFSVVAKAFYGQAEDQRFINCIVNAYAITPTLISMGVGITRQIRTSASAVIVGVEGINNLLINWDDQAAGIAVTVNEGIVFGGGLINCYDGSTITELGYNLYPEIVSIDVVASGGSLSPGTYSYVATYRWEDVHGNLYESAPSPPQTVIVSAGSSVSELEITLPLTVKQNVFLRVFSTGPNGTLFTPIVLNAASLNNTIDIPFFNGAGGASLTTGIIQVTDSGTANTVDTTPLYTTGGVVDNISPPASTALLAHNNRVFLVDSLNPNTFWYTKTLVLGQGISFSDLFTSTIDAFNGSIVALAEMDEKIIIIEQDGVLFISGDGPTNNGLNSTFSFPQRLPSDVGGLQAKGVITSPMGVHFPTVKGYYLCDRSLQIKYWGSDVEGFNNNIYTDAQIMPGTTQIRFLASSGMTLVYDYFYGQWGSFTNHLGLACDIYLGNWTYLRTDGSIFQETPGYYLDNKTAFSVSGQLSYLKMSAIQGFQRVRRLILLGDAQNGPSGTHALTVTPYYNYSTTTPYSAIPYLLTSPFVQFRERLPVQKCESVSFLIQEVTTGSSLDYVDLSDITLEVGLKKGAFKLPATQTVG